MESLDIIIIYQSLIVILFSYSVRVNVLLNEHYKFIKFKLDISECLTS